jgi:hypothetical protein
MCGAGITGPDANGVYSSTLLAGAADVTYPSGVSSATIKVNLTVTEGQNCSGSSGDVNFNLLSPLTVAITEKSMVGSTLTVNLTASGPTGTSFQWQRLDSSTTWANISGATSSTLAYSSFEADSTASVVNLDIGGDAYQGQLYQVQVRVVGQRTANGVLCSATSAPITLKKVLAVDP